MTLFLIMSAACLLSGFVGMFCGVRHYLHCRDAEWRQWAQDRGIDCDYPAYGYTRRDAAR